MASESVASSGDDMRIISNPAAPEGSGGALPGGGRASTVVHSGEIRAPIGARAAHSGPMSPLRGRGRHSDSRDKASDRLRAVTSARTAPPAPPAAGPAAPLSDDPATAATAATEPTARPAPPRDPPDEDAVSGIDVPAPPYAVPVDRPGAAAPAPGPRPSPRRRRAPAPGPAPGPVSEEGSLPRGYAEVAPPPLRPSLTELLAERLQLSAPDGRARLSRAGLGGLLLVCVAAVAVTAWFALGGAPTGDPAPRLQADAAAAPSPSGADAPAASGRPPDEGPAAGTPGAAAPQGEVTVHVGGDVQEPGVVTLPAGSRVADAIEAAGGVADGAGTGTLNLARPLADGEQILVGEEYEQSPPGTAPPAPKAGAEAPAEAPIDLNTATQEQLQELPGVGPVLAERIIAFRTQNGGFTSVEQLQGVSGIGEKRYAELKDLVQVGVPPP